jgi:hypothetical protein
MLKGIFLSLMGLFMLYSLASAELVDNNDGTVTDTASGLIWQQAEPGAMSWDAALAYCESLELAGHDDWRLPNRNELLSIVNYEASNPSIDTLFFPGATSSAYWSSTTYASNTDYAWDVYFGEGGITNFSKTNSYNVRAVRGGQ